LEIVFMIRVVGGLYPLYIVSTGGSAFICENLRPISILASTLCVGAQKRSVSISENLCPIP
jgi:hypothetical protein